MAVTLAVAGKGGTGKTTLSGLLVRHLVRRKQTPVLAVDADANANLDQILGVEVEQTIGGLREEILSNIDSIPDHMPKDTYLEYRIQELLVESKGFDLLVMGRPEGPGCYCYVNSILRRYADMLADNYRYVVVDNEAGMEHLSRRTTQDVDYLLVCSDPSLRGIETAARIRDLSKELKLTIGQSFLVISKIPDKTLQPVLRQEIEKHSLTLLGTIPFDKEVESFDLTRRSVLELKESSSAVQAVSGMMGRLGL